MKALKTINGSSEYYDEKQRRQFTKMAMKMFSYWKLSSSNQLSLLGLNENSRYMLQRYRKLESIIPAERDKLDRVGYLLAIFDRLYSLFPENESLRYSWITRKNSFLLGKEPVEVMIDEGIVGLAKISKFLDLQMVA